MAKFVHYMLLLTLVAVWTALPAGPMRAMTGAVPCSEVGSVLQHHSAHARTTVADKGTDCARHGQMCDAFCMTADAARLDGPFQPRKVRVSRIVVDTLDLSLASQAVAPTPPPPRN